MFQLRKVCFGVILILAFVFCVDTQICTERITSLTWVPETYYRTYSETYNGNCIYSCIKTRYRIIKRPYSKIVPKYAVEEKKVCCSGYTRDERLSYLQCLPICSPECTNGYCKRPDECSCNAGYEIDETNAYKCSPICNNTCGHGTCIAPDVCECDIGYRFDNNTCESICTNTDCGGSSSETPNINECKTGYKISSNGACVPTCSNGCLHGTCVAPETCTCHDRWHNTETGECVPICDIDWIGGPQCECLLKSGYENYKIETCIYDCPNGICIEGICISPDVCRCDKGFNKTNSGLCEPFCSSGCGNGTCIRPDVCQCDTGYKINVDNVYSQICIPECKNCNGTCVAPGKCINFLEPQSTTVDMPTDCENVSCTIKENSTPSKTDTKNYITTTIKVASEATNPNNEDKVNSDKAYIQNNWSSYWIYVALTIIALTLVSVSFLIVKRKAVASVFTRRSYVVEEDQAFVDCQSLQTDILS